MSRRRRRKRRRNGMLLSIVTLLIVIAGIKGLTNLADQFVEDKTSVVAQNERQEKQASTKAKKNKLQEKKPEDAEDPKKDTTEGSKQEDTKKEEPKQEDTEQGESKQEEANRPNIGETLENQQVDLAGLDPTSVDWGQGTIVDDKNRPTGCLMYQEKYGQYNAYFIAETDEKVIYLSFDEGYEYGFTPSILATLKEKNVKADFFVTEPYAKSDPDLVRQMIDEGHEVGNHSVTHPAMGLPSQSLEDQEFEVDDNHKYILDNFGYNMHLFRYPTGRFSQQSLAMLNNHNYKSVFWSYAYKDYDVNNQPDQQESLQKMVAALHPGAIYLLHAESETNAAVLGSFIDQARAAGYEFRLFQ